MAKKIPAGVTPDLYKEYKRLADRADKRLLRLKRLAESQPQIYGNVKAYAYRTAEKSIGHWDQGRGTDKPRFARNTPTTDADLKKKIKDIQAFLDKPTSTKSGIEKIYKKRADTLNERFNTSFTWEDWARFGARGFWDRQDGKFTYNELIKVAKAQKAKKDLTKAYDKAKQKPDKMSSAAKEIMREFSITNSDLNLLNKTVNTLFESNEGIVLKQAKKYMQQSGLNYDTMFT